MELIIQFYKVNYANYNPDIIEKRQQEINYCLMENMKKNYLNQIHILYELDQDLHYLNKLGIDEKHPKITIYKLGKRINYASVFIYANTYLAGKLCIYMHADMKLHFGFEILDHDTYLDNVIYTLTAHNQYTCDNTPYCHCTRKFHTDRGVYTPTIDGIVFKANIPQNVIDNTNYVVHRLGAENKLVYHLKFNDYHVYCPNNILIAYHIHHVQIYDNPTRLWIDVDGNLHPKEYFSNMHSIQKKNNIPFDKRITGGGIPFFIGNVQIITTLI